MANETRQLAEYAVAVRFADLPPEVVQRTKDSIADTIATVIYGYDLPWSQMVVAYVKQMGARGKSVILGPGGARVRAPLAALANGTMAHAFELDNLTWPNSGVHPGATMLLPALAVAQERGIGGRELIAAFVAGAETMIRIGRATKHNNETRGFHAPGTTGPFGAAIAVGRLMRFDADKMTNAIGIAGSLSGGLLEFARSGTGAMVKRLHLGRAAESGILAASLAADGFTGPTTVLEGPFGYLNVFCGEHDLPALTHELGREYATLRIMLKRFPCHITAHTSVQAVEDLQAEHRYGGEDVASITIAGTQKMATINNIPAPADIMLAQYSIPFSVALAHYRNPRDPRSFNAAAVSDPEIRALAGRVTMTVAEEARHARTLASTVTVTLKDGRVLSRRVADFKGTPESPLNADEMREKFLLLTRHCGERAMERLFDRIQNLENEKSLEWVKVAPLSKHGRTKAKPRTAKKRRRSKRK